MYIGVSVYLDETMLCMVGEPDRMSSCLEAVKASRPVP